MPKLLKKSRPPKIWKLREFYEKRNNILVVRKTGGVGDILMHRMMFEDFKLLMPKARITFACPSRYHEILKDHPFIDEIIDSKDVNLNDYVISFDTTNACCRYEMKKAPLAEKHRSDIWANHCGVDLSLHDMHIDLNDKAIDYGKEIIKKIRKHESQPIVVFSPISAMVVKNLTVGQMMGVIDKLKSMNCAIVVTHTRDIPELTNIGVHVAYGTKLIEYFGVMNIADYVVSVDTGTFHFAGGMKKPLVGIFTFADGKVYGKHFDFELVQKHRDNGDWDCGPCYNWGNCPKSNTIPKPCLTEITNDMIADGIDRMFAKWPWDKYE